MRQIIDDDSDPFDRNGILKDGRGFTVKMLARDSVGPAPHAINDEDRRRMALDRTTIHPELRRDAEAARDEWIRGLSEPPQRDAVPPPPPSHVSAPRPNAGNRPAAGMPVRSFADAQSARDAGYAEYVADLVHRTTGAP